MSRPCVVMLLMLSAAASAQSGDQPHTDQQVSAFLEKNKQPLVLDGNGASFDASLLDVRGKEVFLFGEEHNVTVNVDLDLALLKYLHKTAGVRVYLAEMNYSAAVLINRYLQGGDEKPLIFIFRELRGTLAWTVEYRLFLDRLREWN